MSGFDRRWLRRIICWIVGVFAVLPLVLVVIYGFVPPPVTPLMGIRMLEGEGHSARWVPLDRIAPAMPEAVIAAEDNFFCEHGGFDWESIGTAVEEARAGKRLRGASTLTMQTAKNLFLWPGRSFIRKGLEAYLTLFIEAFWSKRRIMEVYLNVAEWGHGVYGVEAAAQAHFQRSAATLSRRQAALLAAALPNPRVRTPGRPSAKLSGQAQTIETRILQLGPMLDCIRNTG